MASPARTAATPQMITVTVAAPANATYDTAFSVAASSTSGLEVTFSSGGSCTNEGNRFTMRSGARHVPGQVRPVGKRHLRSGAASRPGRPGAEGRSDDRLRAASLEEVRRPAIAVVALATSDLPVSLTASGSCTINGVILRLTGPGSCTVTATQSGDANYIAAPQAVPHVRDRARLPGAERRGKKLAAAKSALAKAWCRAGKVRPPCRERARAPSSRRAARPAATCRAERRSTSSSVAGAATATASPRARSGSRRRSASG